MWGLRRLRSSQCHDAPRFDRGLETARQIQHPLGANHWPRGSPSLGRLIHDVGLRPYSGKRKIAILNDADALAAEGRRCQCAAEDIGGTAPRFLVNSDVRQFAEAVADHSFALPGHSLPTARARTTGSANGTRRDRRIG